MLEGIEPGAKRRQELLRNLSLRQRLERIAGCGPIGTLTFRRCAHRNAAAPKRFPSFRRELHNAIVARWLQRVIAGKSMVDNPLVVLLLTSVALFRWMLYL